PLFGPTVNVFNPVANRPAIPRRTLSIMPTNTVPAKIRLCSLTDDITFSLSGDASNRTDILQKNPTLLGGQLPPERVDRAARYNCAWLLQRPKNNQRSEVNVHVVVYQNRTADNASYAPEYGFDLLQPITPGQVLNSVQVNLTLATPRLNGGKLPL